MSNHKVVPGTKAILLAGILVGGILVSPVGAQSMVPAAQPAGTPAHSRYKPNRFTKRAELKYGLIWGVDELSVKAVESGEVIRFAYRVLDPAKAKTLNEKKSEPALIDEAAGVSLVIPQLEKIGKLRQTGTPVEGKTYWMAFSNKGRRVKRGDRVTVVIGPFRADGLVVD